MAAFVEALISWSRDFSVIVVVCVYLELLQSQIIYTLQRVYTTALSQNAYLSRVCHSFICRMRASIPTTIVVEGVPTGLVGTRQVCCKTSSHKLCSGCSVLEVSASEQTSGKIENIKIYTKIYYIKTKTSYAFHP